jgi:hypothetical protein
MPLVIFQAFAYLKGVSRQSESQAIEKYYKFFMEI